MLVGVTVRQGCEGGREGGRERETYLFDMRRDCTRVSLIEDRRNEHGRQRRGIHIPCTRTRLMFRVFLRRASDSSSRDLRFSWPMHVLAETANEDSLFL